MRAMIAAGPTLLRLDAGAAMRDNSLKAAGSGSSGRWQNKDKGRSGRSRCRRREGHFCSASPPSRPRLPAKAQTGNWPTRPLRIIIPTAPGGSPDMVSRTLGNKLTERFGQPVVVESITQGVGIVGNQMVSKSAPDGHTLAMLTGGFTTQAAVMKSLPYDPVRDFAFVTSVVAYPMFLLVAPELADQQASRT